MLVVCKCCEVEFNKLPSQIKKTNANFCSKSCAATYNNKKFPKRKIPWDTITIEDLSTNEHLPQHRYGSIRSRARNYALATFENKCAHCGYDKHVHTCHIKGVATFPVTAKISEVNHIDNLILLCPNCHWELDNL